MSKPIVSVAGLRGIVDESFTADIIVPYVVAFADLIRRKKVVVGGDSRPSRSWAQPTVEAALRARGVEVISIGLAPTPTVGMMVREFKAGGGIVITASHNPIEWNGLKFFSEKGEFLNVEQNKQLIELITKPPTPKSPVRAGKFSSESDAILRHLETLKESLMPMMPSRRRRLRVVLDCCNGAGSVLSPLVASAFGATPEIIFASPGRPFPRNPEPLPNHIRMLGREVKRTGADFGAALDPDADRMALVDETGRPIGEERTFLLAADAYLGLSGKKTPLGVNLSSTMAVDALAKKYKTTVTRAKIGEAHVLAGMKEAGAAIGGEGNGGVILPAVHPGRDAGVALALILLGMHSRRGTLSAWNRTFPDYAMVKTKVSIEGLPLKRTLNRARSIFKDAEHVDETDGLKFIYKDSFIHIRTSGTEPILRVFVEGPDKGTVKHLIARVQAVLQ